MPLNHLINQGDHPDLTAERQKATFSTEALAAELHGAELAKRRREISKVVARTPAILDTQPAVFLDRNQKIENAMRKIVAVMQMAPEIVDVSNQEEMRHLVSEVFGDDGFPLGLHFIMFMPAINGQADDDQLAEWLPRAMRLEIVGTYAQTELGHGTNLRALETTATYDKTTQEFVLHSPTVTSMKWWPGNLGKSSNYAVVNAQLYTEGRCHGPHNFLIQLRDENTHQVMPGITVGDIGPKFGINTVDNGFLKFDKVRIPRRNMLMRHAKVSPDGVYSPPVHPKLAYGAMVFVRATMIRMQAHSLLKAITIALRYSAIRRQGTLKSGGGEVQILDYQTQQHRLLPALARGIGYWLAGEETSRLYDDIAREVKNGNADQLADLHALLSGMKSVVSFETGKDIEQCRMACGGHGYSQASGLPEIYAVTIGGCTYEGENMVMLLQQARYLVKAVHHLSKGKELTSMVQYLADTKNVKCMVGAPGVCPEEAMLSAIEFVARSTVRRAVRRLDALVQTGLPKEQAWNENAVELTRASRTHTRLWIARCFAARVRRFADPGARAAVTDLLHLYLAYELVDLSHYLYEDGYATAGQVAQLKDTMYSLLAKIRPNAVSYVDSYEVSDTELRSVLGRQDGHVYENLLAWAKQSPLNKTEVLPSFEKYLQPMLQQNKSKL